MNGECETRKYFQQQYGFVNLVQCLCALLRRYILFGALKLSYGKQCQSKIDAINICPCHSGLAISSKKTVLSSPDSIRMANRIESIIIAMKLNGISTLKITEAFPSFLQSFPSNIFTAAIHGIVARWNSNHWFFFYFSF